jgi:uncharacterized YigZ family protein
MRTLAGACRYEEAIRRSRFVAHAARARNPAESLAFYQSVADPQASHNCWAWRINHQVRFNDDGEPASSAGRPILAAIEGRELDQVMIVVTRYFGGVKLGVGGLVRAYGGTASKCLDQGQLVEIIPGITCELEADFALAGALHQLLERFDAHKQEEHFAGNGLRLRIRLPARRLAEFKLALAEVSRGQARLQTG